MRGGARFSIGGIHIRLAPRLRRLRHPDTVILNDKLFHGECYPPFRRPDVGFLRHTAHEDRVARILNFLSQDRERGVLNFFLHTLQPSRGFNSKDDLITDIGTSLLYLLLTLITALHDS